MSIIDEKRIFMFEGCDRTGKSTFISYLDSELKIRGNDSYVLHLMGPNKFKNLEFSNDDKSLIQLAKFNDEYEITKDLLKQNDRLKLIFDRTSFGEYIWTRYWNRTGKYTEYVTSEDFILKHLDVLKQSVYIYFYMSDIDELERRINESEEDRKIFTIYDKTVRENISYVYSLYDELEKIIKKYDISYMRIDSSEFKTFKDDHQFILENF